MTRTALLEKLSALAAEPASGAARVVALLGPAGIGKTTLARAAFPVGETRSWANGDPDNRTVPYSVVAQLLWLLERPGTAGGIELDAARQPFAVGLDLLNLLSQQEQQARPVLVIDDAQWADPASIAALGFAVRRSYADGLLMVLSLRDDEPPSLELGRLLDDPVTQRLTVPGFSAGEVKALAAELGTPPPSDRTARMLTEATGGNPLWIAAALRQGELREPTPTAPLRPPPALSQLVADRVANCSPAAQRVIEAVAVTGPVPVSVALRVAQSPEPAPDASTAEALQAGLLREVYGVVPTVAPAHDLLRSAVYHALSDQRRRELHSRAGEVVPDPVTALRHRSAATTGSSSDLVEALVARADLEAAGQRWSRSGELRLLAAKHASREAGEHVLGAVADLLRAGDVRAAAALADQVQLSPASALRSRLLGSLAVFGGHPDQAQLHLRAAWEKRDEAPPWVGASAAADLSMISVNQGAGQPTRMWARRAVELGPDDPLAHVMLGMAEGVLATPLTQPSPQELSNLTEHPAAACGILMSGGIRTSWSGRALQARSILESALRSCRETGSIYLVVVCLNYLSDACYKGGDWDAAIRYGELAVDLSQDAGLDWTLALVHATAAVPHIARGSFEVAAEHAEASEQAARRLGDVASRLWSATTRARLELALGHGEKVLSCLHFTSDLGDIAGAANPHIQPWQLVRVEALLQLDRDEDANAELTSLELWLARHPHVSPPWWAIRLRTQLTLRAEDSRVAGAGKTLSEVLDQRDGESPFDEALLQLDIGAAWRRRGDLRSAIAQLEPALVQLRALGSPAAARAEQELAEAGRRPVKVERADDLTGRERSVAELVAQGMTNREVAAELFLSVKTVEFHLGRIFSKLGIRSRGGVAAGLWRETAPGRSAT